MDDEPALARKIRDLIRTGRLAGRRPDRMWGGAGSGAECSICSRRIGPEDLEFELEFAAAGGLRDVTYIRAHSRCFHVLECVLRSNDPVLSCPSDFGTMGRRDRTAPESGGAE